MQGRKSSLREQIKRDHPNFRATAVPVDELGGESSEQAESSSEDSEDQEDSDSDEGRFLRGNSISLGMHPSKVEKSEFHELDETRILVTNSNPINAKNGYTKVKHNIKYDKK